MWQILSNCVATMKRLKYRHLDADRGCSGNREESINHFYLNILQFQRFEIYQMDLFAK